MSQQGQGPAEKSLVRVFLERALWTPEQSAYVFLSDEGQEAVSLNYGQLNATVAGIATRLCELAAPTERVLILLPPGKNYVVSFYACLLAGMVAVPVFATTSKRRLQRLRAVIDDCQATVIITTSELRSRLSLAFESFPTASGFKWLEVSDDDAFEAPDEHGKWPLPSASDLAFLQYTSGSTGSPKGVMVSHGNLWANSDAIRTAYELGPHSTLMSWLPPYHDMGLIGGILQPLFCGCRGVMMAPEGFMSKPLRWLEAISKYRATISGGPNFAYELCVRTIGDEELSSLDLSTWTDALSGSEPVRYSTVNAFCEKFRAAGLQRAFYSPCYGLAESTLIVSGGSSRMGPVELTIDRAHLTKSQEAQPLQDPADASQNGLTLVSSGMPVKETLVVIADEAGVALNDGHVGEICVHGPSVTQGYWRRDTATQEVFGAQIDTWPGLKFLRTGDLGFLHGGRLYVTGRSKDLIIVRGRNLYPHDLEDTASAAHPSLRPQSCAAFPIETEDGDGVGLVMELQRHANALPGEIFSTVRAVLVDQHQVQPVAIVLVRAGALPLTSSGKLQRSECRRRFLAGELDALARDDALSSADPLRPTFDAQPEGEPGDAVSWLRAVIASTLRVPVERVEPEQPLASLGMDSLAAVSVVAAVTERFDVELAFSSFLGDACVRSLADQIEEAVSRRPVVGAGMDRLAENQRPTEAVASVGQQGLWFLNRFTPQGSSYNVSLAALLPLDTDVDALERALAHVVARHDALRTNFFVMDGAVMQRVRADASFILERAPASSFTRREQLDEYLVEQVQRPFDLGNDLLLRACIHRREDGLILQFVVHHIVVDFWSLVVLMHELTEFYRQETGGSPAQVAAQPASYLAYANWQSRQQESARHLSSAAWWRTQLAEPLPVLNLPVDKARQPVLSERGASIPFEIDSSLSAQLKALALRKGATLYNVLLAAYYVLLHRMSGQDDLVVGTPTAGRARREHEDVIGYFVNSAPLRLQLSQSWSFDEVLDETAKLANESFQHAHYPFARIVADQLAERDTSRHPVFQTMFALQKAHRLEEAGVAPFVLGERGARFHAGGLRLESYPIEVRSCPFDLWMMMAESEGRLLGSLQYNTDLFLPQTALNMVEMFKAVLGGLLADPRRAIGRWLLSDTAGADAPLHVIGSPELHSYALQELFDEQARKTPDAIAVEHGTRCLSYSELLSQSDAWARLLRGHGVEGGCVAILADRSVESVVATLAVLKAGAAYVPLDPAQPRERLTTMAADCGCVAVLTVQRHIAMANRLHWDVDRLSVLICLDADDPVQCVEQADNHVDRKLWDYVAERAADDIDASGWMDSYTGEHFSREAMREYVENTVAKVVPHLTPASHVLEIGCGSGLTMFALADRVAHYCGTDLSPAIIAKNQQKSAELGLGNLELKALAADELALLEAKPFDAAILNSVVQLFPGHNFLIQVCRQVIARMKDQGVIFFGDVMDAGLRGNLLQSLNEHARLHAGMGHKTKTDWERELFLGRDFFHALASHCPEIQSVEITDKIGHIDNELKRFRYDVVLRIDKTRGADQKPARGRVQLGRLALGTCAGRAAPPAPCTMAGAAYVMYTSGSTGTPKGIVIPHRAVARLVQQTDYVTFHAGDRIAHLSNPAFDAATFEIWGALLNGGCLCVVDRQDVLSPDLLADRLKRDRIRTLFLTGAVFNMMAASEPAAFKDVTYLLVGGEVMDPRSAEAVTRAGGPSHLLNMYGPTECTTFATWHELINHPPHLSVPIGRPIAYTGVCVIDDSWQMVPPGVPGELCIAGPGLAHGYVGRPGMTADRFIPHPRSAEPGQRLYRTGDRARCSADGKIQLLGRMDRQIKLRGFRIELDEVEAALLGCPGVSVGAVVRHQGRAGPSIVAYVAAQAASLCVDDIRAALKRTLPDYMMPAHIAVLPALPLTRTGKLDRQSLERRPLDASQDGAVMSPPETRTERLIASIWKDVLGLSSVGAEAHFFECGGHSLLATQVVSRLGSAMALDIPLRLLFEFPVLKDLARQIDASASTSYPSAIGQRIGPQARPERIPLSCAQRRMWLLSRMEPGSVSYNVSGGIWIDGALNVGAMHEAMRGIMARHEVLRTVMVDADEPWQRIVLGMALPWQELDLTALEEVERASRIRGEIERQSRSPFDLSTDALLRCQMIRVGEERHLLLIAMHHAACDGWSLGVMLQELSNSYEALCNGRQPNLPALGLQYADYAVWQHHHLEQVVDEQLPYWKEKLSGAPGHLALPWRTADELEDAQGGGQVQVTLEAGLVAALRQLSNSRGVSLFMTLFAAFHVLLQRYSGQKDICVGTPVANRNRQELESLIGFFVNTLVLRVDASGAVSFEELLKRVAVTAMEAYQHQDLPFDVLVEKLRPSRAAAGAALFQSMFSFQNTPAARDVFKTLRTRVEAHDTGTAKFEISVHLEPAGDEVCGYFQYDKSRLTRTTVERMVQGLLSVLNEVATRPTVRLADLQVLDTDDLRRAVHAFNDTVRAFQPRRLNRMFEACVQVAPSQPALWCEANQEWMTYARLNDRANQLAHRLMALGSGPGKRVAVCLGRSNDFVIASMAVMKTGAAYVPLDPAMPADRLAWMLDDSDPVVVLAESELGDLAEGRTQCRLDRPGEQAVLDGMPLHDPDVGAGVDDLAYVMYTSGSTGRPKGVMVTHRGLANRFQWQWRVHGYGPDDRFFHKSPSGFDTSAWEMFLPLAHGARLVVAEAQGHRDPVYILQAVIRHCITVIDFVPSMLRAFIDGLREEDKDRVSLRHIVLGGEALPLGLIADCRKWFNARLYNQYGPTETSIGVTAWICPEKVDVVRIGRPIDNVSIYLLDDHQNPVPPGVAGELYIGGAAVGLGYLGKPGLTASAFLPDPFSAVPGARMYRSGDLARHAPDGQLDYLGRLDLQVKIRGVRIELGEIESVLLAHPEVKECVVIAHGDDGVSERQLLAYVVLREGLDTGPLAAYARARLPDVMQPAHIMALDTLPLNQNDKVDRAALPIPAASVRGGLGYVAPRDETERRLTALWAELLKLDKVGVQDDFFRLGGHSLLAVRLAAKVRQSFGIELPIRRLFEAPTVEKLARVMADVAVSSAGQGMPAIQARARQARRAVEE